jgi:hypothetical protein
MEIEMPDQYQCCFCGQAIKPMGVDVGGLIYTTNVDGPQANQHDQHLWCHASCLKKRLHPSVPLYVLDLVDLPSVEESSEGHQQ